MTRIKVGKQPTENVSEENKALLRKLKSNEVSLMNSNRALKVLTAINQLLLTETDEHSFLDKSCKIITESNNYSLTWIGFAQNDQAKTVKPVAFSGFKQGYIKNIKVSWGDNKWGSGPTGIAIRTGKIQLARHLMDNPIYKPWHHIGHLFGINASCTFPFTVDNVKAALMIYSSDENAFDRNEIKLLHQLSKNISHGILHIRNQKALENKNKQVEHLLIQTLEVASLALEKRDPYTSGHQHRTADLATAIAMQMKLPQEQIRAIALGAMVHDIGKIYVPAEILNRPGKLTDIEMSLIKTHPQAGFELLKNIDYPWPIAQIILQHHERLNGSGYPHGLKGDEILLESKIVAVADVVEAMITHRPYRPAHSIADALHEIKRNKDSLYDRKVVNACINVFKNKKFKFQSRHNIYHFKSSP